MRNPFSDPYGWLAPSTLILLNGNALETPWSNLYLRFSRSRLGKREDERTNRQTRPSLWNDDPEEKETKNQLGKGGGGGGRRKVREKGEKFARTFFGVLSRRRPRSLDTREPAASFRGSLEYYLSGS